MKNNKNIKVTNITIMETPETDEAIELLEKAKLNYNSIIKYCIYIAILPLLLCLIDINSAKWALIGVGSSIVIAILICLIDCVLKQEYLKPYRQLLKTAISNDEVRHQERIKFRERRRLENEEREQRINLRDQNNRQIQRTKIITNETRNI